MRYFLIIALFAAVIGCDNEPGPDSITSHTALLSSVVRIVTCLRIILPESTCHERERNRGSTLPM